MNTYRIYKDNLGSTLYIKIDDNMWKNIENFDKNNCKDTYIPIYKDTVSNISTPAEWVAYGMVSENRAAQEFECDEQDLDSHLMLFFL